MGLTLDSIYCPLDHSSLFSFSASPPRLSPHSPSSLTFNQRDYKLTETESQAQSSQQYRSQTASLQTWLKHPQAAWCLGSMESTNTEGATAAEGYPEETQEKRQRQKHADHWQQFTRAQFPGGQFPAKFWYQPIKLQLHPFTHTYPANYVRVLFRHLGVYKESRVAYRAILVRVS